MANWFDQYFGFAPKANEQDGVWSFGIPQGPAPNVPLWPSPQMPPQWPQPPARQAEMSIYTPTWGESAKGYASDFFNYLGADRYNANTLADKTLGFLQLLPPVNMPIAKNEMDHAFDRRDPLGFAIAALGAIPGVGPPLKAAARAARVSNAGLQSIRGRPGYSKMDLQTRVNAQDAASAPQPQGLDFWQHTQNANDYAKRFITPGDLRVSTRFPTGMTAAENPLKEHLSSGLPELLRSDTLGYNMDLMSKYPGLAHTRGMPPEDAAKAVADHAAGNMKFVYDNAPPVMQQRSPHWYDGANAFTGALAERYGVPRPAASGGTAVLSPQKDWFQNASLAERVGDMITGAPKPWSSDMAAYAAGSETMQGPVNAAIVKRITGKKLSQLDDPLDRAMWVRLYDEAHNPRHYRSITPEGNLGDFARNADGTPSKVAWGSGAEVAKAIQMYESGGNMETISRLLGYKHKVRSFYNNIEVPNDMRFGDVTADTHQVAAGLLRPLSGNTPEVAHNFGNSLPVKHQPPGYQSAKSSAITGLQGTYPLYVGATQQVAPILGLPPRAAQSATWEPVRELFTDVFKSNKTNVGAIDDIWRAYDRKEITIDQARAAILSRAGGIGEPSWARSGSPTFAPSRASTYR